MRLSLIRLLPRVQTHHQIHDDTHAAIACDMLNPGTVSGACFDGAHSPWPRPFAPPTPQQIALPCSPASQLLWPRPTSHARASSATPPRLPDADRRTRERTLNRRPDVGYPRFRRDPFARDVLLDPGGTAMPRMTALHMLGSTISTVSAPANSSFRGSITHPTQPLCTLRVRRRRRLTQHSLPGGLLGLTWAGLAPADRASFARAFSYSITSSARASSVGGISSLSALAVLRLIKSSMWVGNSTGRSPGLAPFKILST